MTTTNTAAVKKPRPSRSKAAVAARSVDKAVADGVPPDLAAKGWRKTPKAKPVDKTAAQLMKVKAELKAVQYDFAYQSQIYNDVKGRYDELLPRLEIADETNLRLQAELDAANASFSEQVLALAEVVAARDEWKELHKQLVLSKSREAGKYIDRIGDLERLLDTRNHEIERLSGKASAAEGRAVELMKDVERLPVPSSSRA